MDNEYIKILPEDLVNLIFAAAKRERKLICKMLSEPIGYVHKEVWDKVALIEAGVHDGGVLER